MAINLRVYSVVTTVFDNIFNNAGELAGISMKLEVKDPHVIWTSTLSRQAHFPETRRNLRMKLSPLIVSTPFPKTICGTEPR